MSLIRRYCFFGADLRKIAVATQKEKLQNKRSLTTFHELVDDKARWVGAGVRALMIKESGL